MKDFDLHPSEWKSSSDTSREPIFGSGAPQAIAYLIGWFAVSFAVYSFTHTPPPPAPVATHLEVGQSATFDGWTIKRTH